MKTIEPGTRFGKRVVVRREVMIHGSTKRWGLVVRCDCGRLDLVNTYTLVKGRAPQCVDCKHGDKSRQMLAKWAERKRKAREQSDATA